MEEAIDLLDFLFDSIADLVELDNFLLDNSPDSVLDTFLVIFKGEKGIFITG